MKRNNPAKLLRFAGNDSNDLRPASRNRSFRSAKRFLSFSLFLGLADARNATASRLLRLLPHPGRACARPGARSCGGGSRRGVAPSYATRDERRIRRSPRSARPPTQKGVLKERPSDDGLCPPPHRASGRTPVSRRAMGGGCANAINSTEKDQSRPAVGVAQAPQIAATLRPGLAVVADASGLGGPAGKVAQRRRQAPEIVGARKLVRAFAPYSRPRLSPGPASASARPTSSPRSSIEVCSRTVRSSPFAWRSACSGERATLTVTLDSTSGCR